jgi:hypothetical protein
MAELRHRGTRAIQRLVEYAPSTGGLALWVQHRDLADPAAPVVATDGHTLFYGPASPPAAAAQAGLVAHEVLHIALRHPQRYLDLQQRLGDVDLQLFNICADAIVNSSAGHLAGCSCRPARSAGPPAAATLGRRTTAEAALLEWDVERAVPRHRRPAAAAAQAGGGGGRATRQRAAGPGTQSQPRSRWAGRPPPRRRPAPAVPGPGARPAARSRAPARNARSRRPKPSRAPGANACCAPMPATASSRCCAP